MSHFQAQHSTHQTVSGSAMPPHVGADGALSALDEMRQRPQWVCWKYVPQPVGNDGKPRKPKKPPIDPKTGRNASHGDPGTWGAYEQARKFEQVNKRTVEGIGYVFTDDDNIIGIDLDNCRNPETGVLEPWAKQIIDLAETYAEVSVSGTGVHLLARGKRDRAFKCDKANVEIYQKDRYFVWTANHIESTPTSILPAHETIDILIKRVEDFKVFENRGSEGTQKISQGVGDAKFSKDNFWDRVNSAALSNLDAWVKDLFPKAKYQLGTQAWRVSSKDLGRDFDEDLSIHPSGISDFGEEKTFNAIKLIQKYCNKASAKEAAFWLCERLGVAPKDLGWIDAKQPNHSQEDQPWPNLRPIVAELEPVKKFDPDVMLPQAWRKYLLDKAHAIQSNIDHLGVFSMSAYGSLLGANIRIKPRRNNDSYKVCPNIWSIAVAPPSMGKSPIFDAVMAPLNTLQDQEQRDHKKEIASRIDADKEIWMKIKGAKKRAQKAFDKGNIEEGEEALKNCPKEPPPLPAEPVMRVDTTTVPALGETLRYNPLGVAILKDELSGFFASVAGREKEQDRSFYLSAYNGNQSHRYDTISRGSLYLERVCLTIGGFIQPSKITPIVSDANSDSINDGMIQRFQLMTMPDPIEKWIYVDQADDHLASLNYKGSFDHAHHFREVSKQGEIVWSFTEKAQKIFADWLTEINTRARSGSLPGALQQHLIKMDKCVAQIATILEIAEGRQKNITPNSTFEVGVEATERAIVWARYLESHARRIYGSTEGLRACQGAKTIIQKRAQLPDGFNARDVYRHQWTNLKDANDANKAIDVLLDEGYLRGIKEKNFVKTDGRNKQMYFWHPGLEDFLESEAEQKRDQSHDDFSVSDDKVIL